MQKVHLTFLEAMFVLVLVLVTLDIFQEQVVFQKFQIWSKIIS